MFLLSAEEMRRIDALAISGGIPSEVLMENAATATVCEILKQNTEKVIIFAGKGQNAGDGFAIARRLFVKKINVEVVTLFEEGNLSGAALTNFSVLKSIGVPVKPFRKDEKYYCTVAVDCILGTGAKGVVSEKIADAISTINSLDSYVISADIPSGIAADTGEVLGYAVKADKTVTYGFLKAGLYSPLSTDFVGEIVLDDVSIPENSTVLKNVSTFFTTEKDVYFPRTFPSSHKGDNGKILIAGGSEGLCGAMFMAADAAVKMGGGLITCATEKELLPIFMSRLYSAMCIDIEKVDFSTYDTVLIGNGFSQSDKKYEIVKKAILNTRGNLIIDADALNMLSKNTSLLKEKNCHVFITPHIVEFSRLSGLSKDEVLKNRVALAKEFAAEYGVEVILKSASTVVASPDGFAYINSRGNEGMAKGGSGDVLSGMLAGAVYKYKNPSDAARSICFIHSLAGDLAAEKIGKVSMSPADIINYIPSAIKFLK